MRAVANALLEREQQIAADDLRLRELRPGRRGRPWLRPDARRLAAAVTIVLLVAGWALLGPGFARTGHAFPPALAGHWQTTTERFAGRVMILTPDSIGIIAGKGASEQRYPLRVVRSQAQGRPDWYDFEYDTADGPLRLSLSLGHDGLRLRNQPDALWIRTETGR
jgi:hypothetical protein